ncbi:48ac7aee-4810-46c8-84d6-f8556c4a085b [Thermothielavioides terrestris]|uniref:48ac7aee-4810-46c8-84d6-f8556c4a085b n=1 Tax=Thermothielavioides terrestris TaxID=2587410 RepID=A0A446BR10_9PEZI|nr:48ac7aee-4810-46c8-84d6-f8556c4a085b [Thermothielavioides terrestris]
MRYEDWDVILFPTGRDSKIPLKEFKVACHVVPDVELAHIHGPAGVPVMTCFVPSLPPGVPFQISLHCWRRPEISQFTRTYSKHSDLVKFEARIMIDGRLVASAILDRDVNGPHLVTSTFEFTKTGELERLRFPQFRRELLFQSHWNPGDDIGRIKIIVSEGFPRDSLSAPIERVKNVVVFSFQHAPLEILETNGIAWPNPSMWRCAVFNSAMPVPTYHVDDGVSSHAHSPGKKSMLLKNFKNQGFPPPATASGMCQPQPGAGVFANQALQVPYLGRSTMGSVGTPSYSELSAESAYADWFSAMTSGSSGNPWDEKAFCATTGRNPSKQPSDTLMADYDSSQQPEPMHISGSSLEDDPMCLKVPTNTPTGVPADDGQNPPFPTTQLGVSLPADFASSLTQSLLNQPFPLPSQQPNLFFPQPEAKASKENRQSMRGSVDATMQSATAQAGTSGPRRASQQLFGINGLDGTLPISASDDRAGKDDNASPALEALFPGSSRNDSAGEFGSLLANLGCHNAGSSLATPNSTGQTEPGSSNAPNGVAALGSGGGGTNNASGGGNGSGNAVAKRTRNFTPASVRAIDEEDEPRRASPRVRVAGYGGADIPGDVGQ